MAKREAPRRRYAQKRPARPAQPILIQTSLRYIESSALVAALLEHDGAVVRTMPVGTQQVTSGLTLAVRENAEALGYPVE